MSGRLRSSLLTQVEADNDLPDRTDPAPGPPTATRHPDRTVNGSPRRPARRTCQPSQPTSRTSLPPRCAKKTIQHKGREYEIWSSADRTLLENMRFLAAYCRPGIVPEADMSWLAWQIAGDGYQLADVERRLATRQPDYEVRPPFLALIWSGRLTTELFRPLSGDRALRRSA
ncbi:hypothetical protein JCM13580A_02100 [Streptomyces drozdowiczii]